VEESAKRLGVDARVSLRAGDVLLDAGAPVGLFDRVLVDAPCSNTGVLARRVEARWRFAKLDLRELHGLQLRLVERAASALKPGGVLVYATCSIEEDENRGVAMAFVDRHRDFKLVHEWQRFPGGGPGDGGYAVAFQAPTAS
jgi:16S rRNA (cytosine967-C5)-methyltransferase